MTPTIVSFYTPDFEYPAHAKRLAAECYKLGLPSHIQMLPSQGSYLANTCLKPRFLLQAMQTLDRPLLWVDVDGSVLRNPVACVQAHHDGCDVGFRPITQADRVRRWHVGTIWLNNTYMTLAFLERWAALSGSMTDEAALHGLDKALPIDQWLKVWAMPPEYFYIGNQPPLDTVVQHRLSGHKWKRAEYMRAIEDERRNG